MEQEIIIILKPDIVYVAGTINGATVVFDRISTTTWVAHVNQSEDNTYVVSIEAYNDSGLSSSYSTTLYYDTKLIYDRTETDLALETDKAFYNATDLNRVESATHFLESLLKLYSYYKGTLIIKKDWKMSDFPTTEQMTRYLRNIRVLMDSYYLEPTTPPLPSDMEDLTIEEANNIEKILHDIPIIVFKMVSQFYYSNEVYLGEIY